MVVNTLKSSFVFVILKQQDVTKFLFVAKYY